MTPEQFCYWLQGFVEMSHGENDGNITPKQWQMITDHLKEVFTKKTPTYVHPLDRQYTPSSMPSWPDNNQRGTTC